MQIKTDVIPEIKIGDTVSTFIVALARMNPQLQSLFFTMYSPMPGVHERIGDLRSRPAAEIVSNFLYDDNHTNKHWQVSASDLSSEIINEKIASLPSNLALGLESKCITQDGSVKYIPMMDFNLGQSASNLELLKEFLVRLAYKGVIGESGASYHFYGFDFLDHSRWVRFMGECLLVPWSDSRWIGHSLLAGGGDLRISTTELKPKLPVICEILR